MTIVALFSYLVESIHLKFDGDYFLRDVAPSS